MNKNTIVIADDDRSLLLLMRRYLADDGYTIHSAEDGASARMLLESNAADVVALITDWSMPVMNGIDLLRWVKGTDAFKQIPVIMETAMSHADNIKMGIDAGAYYYIIKPFEKSVLRSIVRAAVSDYRNTQSLLRRVNETEDLFNLLTEATFRFRTPSEAESLALRIAGSSADPQKALIITELLLNAIEHGNLAISYDEKSEFIEKGKLREEVEKRLASSEYAAKHAELSIVREDSALILDIKDQGKGFDFDKFLSIDESRVFDNHGRGIAMVNVEFHLEYLGNGNHVRVKIPTRN